MARLKKRYFKIAGLLILIPILLIVVSNFIVENGAKGKTFSDIDTIPKNRVGLILGTSKKIRGGAANP